MMMKRRIKGFSCFTYLNEREFDHLAARHDEMNDPGKVLAPKNIHQILRQDFPVKCSCGCIVILLTEVMILFLIC